MTTTVPAQTRAGCGRFGGVCGGRAPALATALLALFATTVPVIGCGGDDDSGAGEDAGPMTCEELRVQPGRASTFSADPIWVHAGGMTRALRLAPPHSAPLSRVSLRPARTLPRRAAEAAGARDIGLRLLLIAPNEERASYQAAAAALQRIGVPHDVLLSGTDAFDRDRLYDDSGACRYAGVILSHDDLGVDDGSGWHSTFAEADWNLLADYEVDCGAREAIWYAHPTAELGLAEAGSFDSTATETATLTADGAAGFSYLVPDGVMPIREVFGYLGEVSDPETTVPLLQTSEGGVLAAVHTRPDQTEVLAVTVDSGPESVHSQLLEYGIVEWVSRGLFVGKRRVYLSPQIDDVFLKSALWSDSGDEPTYRASADDVGHLLDWWNGLDDRLPHGSSVRIQLAFNGAGAVPAYYPDQSLVTTLLAEQGQFYWINHTWDHANLDGAGEDMVTEEFAHNCEQAEEWGLTHFDCSEAITPEVTGLENPDAVAGMLAAGIRHVVSDASQTEERHPSNPGSNPSPNVGRPNPLDDSLLQVPRHPTSIFFDCSTPDEEVGLYNQLYRDFWGRDLSYTEVIDVDTELAVSYLLSYDVDPLMFHQANLRFWNDGSWHSLYTDWIDRLVERFGALVRLPIVGLDMKGISRVMQERGALDGCGLTATLSADRTRIHLDSAGPCVVPITGLDAPDAGEVETYAGVPTTHVTMTGCDPVDVDVP